MNARGAGRRVALAPPDERDRQMYGRLQAAQLEGGSLEGGERAREDGGREASRGERAQQERVAALESEAEGPAGVSEQPVEHRRDRRAAARRHDRVLREVGDGDIRGGRGAAGSEAGDHFV